MNFSLVQADKDLFAVYQTIYSNADIEMWYDWNRRLGDTKWTDQCYFLLLDGQKVGGIIITDDVVMFPFLIPPFCDKIMFWRFITKNYGRNKINGILAEDASILPMFGYKIKNMSQVMCRPTDTLSYDLSDDFICRPLDINTESEEIGRIVIESYEGGICNEINGFSTVESAIEDAKNVLKIYSSQNLSHVIVEKATSKIVAVCLAGISDSYTHGYAEIADLCVLPDFRGIGLAKYMICKSVTDSYGLAPFIKLFVYIGNNAEYLYNELGFISGPRFANMIKR